MSFAGLNASLVSSSPNCGTSLDVEEKATNATENICNLQNLKEKKNMPFAAAAAADLGTW
jgi:hypothetical protein